MASYRELLEEWKSKVGGISIPGADNSLDLVISVLEKQLDRASAAIKSLDDKASLVIPGVAAIAGIVGSNVRTDIASQTWLAIMGAATGVAAVAAVCMAVYALRPQQLGNGVLPLQAVRGVGIPEAAGKLAYAKSLGWAVESAEALTLRKAFAVNWAFRIGAAGVLLLTLFIAFGGLAAQGGSKP
jgi:hypothetical protein